MHGFGVLIIVTTRFVCFIGSIKTDPAGMLSIFYDHQKVPNKKGGRVPFGNGAFFDYKLTGNTIMFSIWLSAGRRTRRFCARYLGWWPRLLRFALYSVSLLYNNIWNLFLLHLLFSFRFSFIFRLYPSIFRQLRQCYICSSVTSRRRSYFGV